MWVYVTLEKRFNDFKLQIKLANKPEFDFAIYLKLSAAQIISYPK